MLVSCHICAMKFDAPQSKCNTCGACKERHRSTHYLRKRIEYLLTKGVRKGQFYVKIQKLDLPTNCNTCGDYFWRGDIKKVNCWTCEHDNNCLECNVQIRTDRKYCSRECHYSHIKGMSYKERFGTTNVACGAQKGEANLAKRPSIRKKISVGVKKSYTPELRKKRSVQRSRLNREKPVGVMKAEDNYGNKFRSKLEARFSNLLHENNIEYDYEVVYQLEDGTQKVVDFKIGEVLVEISGYAYKAWQEDFNEKMKKLRSSVDNPIMVLTYPDKVQDIRIVSDADLFTGSVENEPRILKTIDFCNKIIRWKQMEKEIES